jgi:MFS family permease
MIVTNKSSVSFSSISTMAWVVCGLGMLFYGYEYILRIAPSVMVPELSQYFHISAQGIGTLVGLYYMAYTPMQIVVGPVLDMCGPRRVLFVALLACVVGNFLFAHAHLLLLAGIGRFLVGLGSSFAFVGALKLASAWLPSNYFATYAGIVTALAMVLGFTGDLTLTEMVHKTGWQYTLLICTIIGLILVPIMGFFIHDTPPGKIVVRAHGEIFRGFMKVITNHQVWLSGMVACMLYLALSALAEMWGIPFLREAFKFSSHQAALANSMIFVGWLIGGPLFGWFSDQIHNRRIPLMFGAIGAAISLSIVLYSPLISFIYVCIFLLLFGLFTSAEVICFAVGYENAPKTVSATAVAFVNMITMFGGFIFQPLIGVLLDTVWRHHETFKEGIRVYTLSDYRIALSVIPLAMLISAVLALTLRESKTQRELPPNPVSIQNT